MSITDPCTKPPSPSKYRNMGQLCRKSNNPKWQDVVDRVEAFLFGVRHLQCLVLLGMVFRFRILMKARRWWQLEHGGAPLYKHQNMVVSISFWTPSSPARYPQECPCYQPLDCSASNWTASFRKRWRPSSPKAFKIGNLRV